MLREKCPLVPGVYGWLDKNRQLAYVGKSKSLRKRLLSYFAKSPADKKAQRIRHHSHYLVWEPISSELLALIREQELIHRWRPDFNSQGQPTRTQPAFLTIGGSPAANVRLARKPSSRGGKAYGPISGVGRLSEAIVRLNQTFQLRDCPDRTKFQFNNQQWLFDDPKTAKCIRFELGSCPGPCAGQCSARQYQEHVDRAIAFLDGRDPAVLQSLEVNMQQAAASMAYERAAILRNCWEHLSWLDRKLEGLRQAHHSLSGVLPVEARRNRTAWLVLHGGRILLSAKVPTDPDAAAEIGNQITQLSCHANEVPSCSLGIGLQLLVISWLRKNPEMKQQMMSFHSAIEYCETVSRQVLRRSA